MEAMRSFHNWFLQRPWLWFWLACSLLLPIQWSAVYRSEWFWSPPKPIGDGSDYENLAYHVWQGKGFVLDYTDPAWQTPYHADSHDYLSQLSSTQRVVATGRPPMLPLMIGGLYAALGRHPAGFAAVRLMLATCLAVAGALAVYLTAKLLLESGARWEITFGSAAALVFAATHRTLRDYATDFLTEPVALLLTQIFVLCVLRATRSQNGDKNVRSSHTARIAVASAGAVFGAMILVRSLFVVWLPGVGLIMLLAFPGSWFDRLRTTALLLGMACLVCLPWWVRNVYVLDRWMPLGTQGPITLLGGYSDAALASNGDWQSEPALQLQRELAATEAYRSLPDDTQREVLMATEASRRVRTWFWSHLDVLPGMMAKRVYVHWNPYTGRSLLWKVAFSIGVLGLIVWRDRAGWWLVGLLIVSTLSVATLYSTGGRFLVPLYGVLYTLSGLGIAYTARILHVWRRAGAVKSASSKPKF